MNQPVKYWATSLVIDAGVLAMLYLWQIEGIDRAGAVFEFACWALTLMTFCAAFAIDREHIEKNPRPKGFAVYHFCSEIAMLGVLVWVDLMFLASVRLFAVLLFEGARESAKKVSA
jgi:hypothetical protein